MADAEEADRDFQIYVALWRRAEELGTRVQYDGSMEPGGAFNPDPHDRGEDDPLISITRPHYKEFDVPSRDLNDGGQHLAPPDIIYETITLAHEFGHFLSWKERTPRDAYEAYLVALVTRSRAWEAVPEHDHAAYHDAIRAAARAALTTEQLALIVAEEERAWAIGREALEELGFVRLDLFDERARHGVHVHRYRMGLDELWPGDAVEGEADLS